MLGATFSLKMELIKPYDQKPILSTHPKDLVSSLSMIRIFKGCGSNIARDVMITCAATVVISTLISSKANQYSVTIKSNLAVSTRQINLIQIFKP